MKKASITSAKFLMGLKGSHSILENKMPKVAFIGRSNAGKSSLLNSLTNSKELARTSKTPGRTQEINVFLINETHYFMDLPGYGYAKVEGDTLHKLSKLIYWYLFDSGIKQKIVLLIDSEIGPTSSDLEILKELETTGQEILIVLNKIDKIKKSLYHKQMSKLKLQLNGHKLFPYSSKTKEGQAELTTELLKVM
ncbi:MAG: ribosome biogenesis GTP-binding protein YihA/YsxC [Candidatus Paceibacteria bacterium]